MFPALTAETAPNERLWVRLEFHRVTGVEFKNARLGAGKAADNVASRGVADDPLPRGQQQREGHGNCAVGAQGEHAVKLPADVKKPRRRSTQP